MYIVVEQGHTIRFQVNFKDYLKNPIDPNSLEFKVYDRHLKNIETVELDDVLHRAYDDLYNPITGSFFYDYTPSTSGTFYIEFNGLIKNKPTLKRKKIRVIFNS